MKNYLLCIGISVLLIAGCSTQKNEIVIKVQNYQFTYQGPLIWEKSQISTMDSIDFLALYTESGTNETYKDSLVITQQYNQGKGVVLFSQEAVATLKTQGLTIEHTQAESFVRDCDREKKAFRLISYQISSGFVATVPKIYMTQLFGEQDTNTLLLFSHSSEDASEQQQMRKAFSTIHCVK